MKVLVIGSGAREHALVQKFLAEPQVSQVVAAPGNAGMSAQVSTWDVDVSDPEAIADLAERGSFDLVVVGPELPLVNGAADAIRSRGIACFGPSAAAAQLEGSKAFAKEIMAAAGVPTATSITCGSTDEVVRALDDFGPPYVVKDDGLAGGKGVVVTEDRAEAQTHAEACLAKGSDVVIEEFLDGPEVSLFVITDGNVAVPFLAAQDHKRVGDGDTGLNTGGMGSYVPLTWADRDLVAQIMEQVARPTIAEMAHRGMPFAGVLYCGLALTSQGIRVVEFNARFGDPEIQAVLRLLESPLAPLLRAAATGELAEQPDLVWSQDAAVCVVIAAEGYPGDVVSGDEVHGLNDAESIPGVAVVHAGTARSGDQIVTSGGRVLSITARGKDLAAACERAYRAVAAVKIRGSHNRSDIAAAARDGAITIPQ